MRRCALLDIVFRHLAPGQKALVLDEWLRQQGEEGGLPQKAQT
jgi:hypothetical protein